MAQTSIITGQNVRIQQTAATVLQRVLAWVIDYFVVSFVSTVLAVIIVAITSAIGETSGEFLVIILIIAISMYPFWMEVFNNGQSVGKMAMRIRVVCLDGTKPSVSAFFIRWVTLVIDIAMGLAFIIFSKNSQRIGDLAAGTTVVKNPKKRRPELLNAIRYFSKNFKPTYPEASQLTFRQIGTIEKVLDMDYSVERVTYINQLTHKITEMLGVMPNDNNYEHFLITLYNDFQFYATKVV